MATETDGLRHIAIFDGGNRLELALAERVTLADALDGLGIAPPSGAWQLVAPDGGAVEPSAGAGELDEGTVLTLIDLGAHADARGRRTRRGPDHPAGASPAWWMLAAFGIVLAAVAVLAPSAIGPALRAVLATVAAAGAVLGAVLGALRAGSSAACWGALMLAAAAGVVAVPSLPASGLQAAVFAGLAAAGLLAALVSVIARGAGMRAETGVAAVVLVVSAAIWGAAALLGVPASAPCALIVGAVPVALRALPALLLDVPPGAFIDYGRFQTTRWSVRQSVPEAVTRFQTSRVTALVERSATRLTAGTVLLSAAAAAAAPWALGRLDTANPIVFGGQIALAAAAFCALLLGVRRSPTPLLRWAPRAAAVVVAVTALVAFAQLARPAMLIGAAGVLLLAGLAAGLIVVPVARGAHSLFFSRLGDLLEWVAVVVALPAGLVAAGSIDLLRGVMAG